MEELVRPAGRPGLRGRAAQWLSDNPSWKKAIPWAALWVIGPRILVGLMMAAAWYVDRPFLLPVLQANPSLYGYSPLYTTLPGEYLLGVWMRWDAVHYINLAIGGYFNNITGDSVFYPLYFLLIRFFSQVFQADRVLVALVIATLSTFFMLLFLYRIVDSIYGEPAARWSVVALAVYPTALLLQGPYTESLFLALTLAAFWSAYQARWVWAGALGALASLSRGPGMYTPAALAWTAYQQLSPLAAVWKKPPVRKLLGMTLGLGLPLAAGLGFLAWKQWVGFPPLEVVYRDYTHWVVSNPLTSLYLAVRACFTTPDITVVLEAVTALGFIVLSALLMIKPRWRRPEWIIYTLLNLGVFLSRYSTTSSPLQSMGRYVLILFPVFILLGDWLSRSSRRVQFAYTVTSISLLMIFSALYVFGIFVG
jgi:hypothetical protein